jgi:hypothetical protein
MSSPTQRSKKALEKDGWLVAIVEHFNQWAKVRIDLYGFVDLLAIRENEILAVQTTSRSNMSARIKKILAHENYPKVKSAGIKIRVDGWAKNKKGRYENKITEL